MDVSIGALSQAPFSLIYLHVGHYCLCHCQTSQAHSVAAHRLLQQALLPWCLKPSSSNVTGMLISSILYVSAATSEGLPDAVALTSADRSTPASFKSCVTCVAVASENCLQLLRKFLPRRAGALTGKAYTTCVLVADGAISCARHMRNRNSQIPRTEDCCSALRCTLSWGMGSGSGNW